MPIEPASSRHRAQPSRIAVPFGIPQTRQTNPAIKQVLGYYLAFVISQPLAVPFGPIFISATQLFVISSSVYMLVRIESVNIPVPAWRLLAGFTVYACLCIVSSLISDGQLLESLSLSANVFWFVLVGRAVSRGTTHHDISFLIRGMLLIGIIPFVTGLIELLTGSPLFTYGIMRQGLSADALFYLRGTHTDKIDFASEIAINTMISVAALRSREVANKVWYALYAMGNLILAVFTYSTTGLIGIFLGVIMLLITRLDFASRIRFIAGTGVSIAVAGYIFSTTELGQQQLQAYELKYELQVNQAATYNFRQQAVFACWEGFLKYPLIGIGFGNSPAYIQRELATPKEIDPHTIVSVLLETGVIGGAVVLGILLWYFWHSFRLSGKGNRAEPIVGVFNYVVLGFSSYMAAIFAGYFHWFDSSIYFMGFLFVLVAMAYRPMHPMAASAPRGLRI